ncbi:phage tail protein [Pseudescherichia sp.]|uniref:phage tail fiber protein n=1 Tax=Pseudescherichia sp. TaxID=2055881 RepID=UPI00289BFF76|nr:phage tail protein [Pseudescherichia sp.]
MIYTTGTIAGNGSTLTGTGTNFTAAGTLIRNGCTVIAMTSPVQVFQITAVNNATQLAVTPAVNPAIPAGTRYAILLSDSLSVDGLALNVAETLNMYMAYMSGFADVMTGTGNVTITINGVSVTVPTQKSLVQKDSNGLVPMSLGGTGSPNAAGARKNLELGDSATRNVHTASYGDTAGVGVALQTNADFRSIAGYDDVQNFPRGVSGGIQSASKYGATGDYVGLLSVRGWGDSSAPSASWQIAVNSALQAFRIPVRASDGASYLTTYKIWNQRNTTVDGNGFIKQASPIARLISNPEVMPPTFTDGDFSVAGVAAVNLEAQGVTAERVGTGVYRVRGAMGLHSDGWTIEIPQDTNGNRLCFVETDIADDGVITVSVFKRRFDIDTAMIVAGEPMDIPEGRWIDLRLEMPADSVYNQQMKAAEEAVIKKQAEQVIKDAESVEQSINPDNQ